MCDHYLVNLKKMEGGGDNSPWAFNTFNTGTSFHMNAVTFDHNIRDDVHEIFLWVGNLGTNVLHFEAKALFH